jgi:hypothetical protein
MRKLIAIFALSIVVSGCGERDGRPRLEPLARGLSEAMQPAYTDFKLEIRALDKGDRVTLHCVLRNVSIAATTIDVDASTLPWQNADFFDINAIAANGMVVHRNPWPVELARISAPSTPLAVASGASIEGEMELDEMPISGLPRNDDLLLLWFTSIRVFHSDQTTELRGATFLKATSAIADKPISPEIPKASPDSSRSGTSVTRSSPDDPWFNPPGRTWIPDPVVVSDMKVALDEALRPILTKRGDLTRPPVRYWFQYVGQGSGVNKTIGVIGRPFPVLPRAAIEFLGAFIPEDCTVLARYVPSKRRIEDLAVGAFGCPRRI